MYFLPVNTLYHSLNICYSYLIYVILVCKKLIKAKSIEMISEEVEEPLDKIKAICDIASEFAPDYDVDSVYEAVIKTRS